MNKQFIKRRFLESAYLMRLQLILALFVVLTVAGFFAQFVEAQTAPQLFSDALPAPTVVEIDESGQLLIRGFVEAVNDRSITVSSWGGSWTILAAGNTTVISGSTGGVAGDISEIAVGDFIGVEGVIATNQSFTGYAALIRNWTTDPFPGAFPGRASTGTATTVTSSVSAGTIPTNTTETSTEETAGVDSGDQADRTATTATTTATSTEDDEETISYAGTVDEVSDTSLSFTDDLDSSYTVELTADVVLVNSDGETIEVDDIDRGDRIELEGTAENGVITTSLIRNTDDGLF